jgi:hypothetical protein
VLELFELPQLTRARAALRRPPRARLVALHLTGLSASGGGGGGGAAAAAAEAAAAPATGAPPPVAFGLIDAAR